MAYTAVPLPTAFCATRFGYALVTLLPLVAATAQAADWQTGAGITLGGYYSDNICLADSDEQGRAAGTATPEVYLRGTGARASLYLNGAVEYDSLADSGLDCSGARGGQFSNRQALIPSLRYRGDLELVENWLTLESDAFVGRNSVDPFAPGGGERFDGRDNTNITYQYGVGALLQRRLFDHTDMRLRYRYNEQFNEVNLFGNSTEDQVLFDLGTDPAASRFSAGVAGRYSQVRYDSTNTNPAFDNTLSSAEVRGSLRLSYAWHIDGLVGEEWNEFTSARDDVDGSYWNAGIRWTPNPRVEVALGTGERFFGKTPRLDLSYRHKRSELTASYRRTLTLPRTLRAGDIGVDGPLDPEEDPDFGQLPGQPPVFGGEPTFIGNSPILDERFTLRYRFSARRTTISISASDSQQTRTEDLDEAHFSSTGITVSRTLSRLTTGSAQLSWSEREGEGADVGPFGGRSETLRLGLALTRQLGNDTRLRLGYQHTSQRSDFALNRYDENRVTLSISHQFGSQRGNETQ